MMDRKTFFASVAGALGLAGIAATRPVQSALEGESELSLNGIVKALINDPAIEKKIETRSGRHYLRLINRCGPYVEYEVEITSDCAWEMARMPSINNEGFKPINITNNAKTNPGLSPYWSMMDDTDGLIVISS
jgi:hypothetical protein